MGDAPSVGLVGFWWNPSRVSAPREGTAQSFWIPRPRRSSLKNRKCSLEGLGILTVEAYFAKSKYVNWRMGENSIATDVPVGITGRRGTFTTFGGASGT